MAKLSKILLNSLFISSTLAQSDTQDDSSESQTFQVTDCNDETDDVSKDIASKDKLRRDTCSWKVFMNRSWSWKYRDEIRKIEVCKLGP